ncbi:MAG: hypothetical protein IH577_02290 [Deltaproteobacteria bacterium]|nr:hypothetical protein [Deltaproteobacteria bacterium]
MDSPRKPTITATKIYLYLLALGLMLFGVFTMLFREYDHRFYGHMDFGEYHQLMGTVFIALSLVLLSYLRRKH